MPGDGEKKKKKERQKSSSSSRKRKQCQECQVHVAQYQCPRCDWRTCSLPCCLRHKERTECNGRTQQQKFMKLSEMNDTTIKRDYLFLEDVLQCVDTAKHRPPFPALHDKKRQQYPSHGKKQRQRSSHQKTDNGNPDSERSPAEDGTTTTSTTRPVAEQQQHPILQEAAASSSLPVVAWNQNHNSATTGTGTHNNLPTHLRRLQQTAACRGIRLLFLPNIMERHKTNRSFVKKIQQKPSMSNKNYNNKNSTTTTTAVASNNNNQMAAASVIHWMVEWCFVTKKKPAKDDEPQLLSSASTTSTQTTTTMVTETSLIWDEIPTLPEDNNRQAVNENGGSNTTTTCWSLFLKKLPCPSNRPHYVEIIRRNNSNTTTTLSDALRDLAIYEYPTIYVVDHDCRADFVGVGCGAASILIQEVAAAPIMGNKSEH